jgi:hypothetical protein
MLVKENLFFLVFLEGSFNLGHLFSYFWSMTDELGFCELLVKMDGEEMHPQGVTDVH